VLHGMPLPDSKRRCSLPPDAGCMRRCVLLPVRCCAVDMAPYRYIPASRSVVCNAAMRHVAAAVRSSVSVREVVVSCGMRASPLTSLEPPVDDWPTTPTLVKVGAGRQQHRRTISAQLLAGNTQEADPSSLASLHTLAVAPRHSRRLVEVMRCLWRAGNALARPPLPAPAASLALWPYPFHPELPYQSTVVYSAVPLPFPSPLWAPRSRDSSRLSSAVRDAG